MSIVYSPLETIDIPVLTSAYSEKLDAPIKVEKIQKALKMMQAGKTPGPDGILFEFYKMYAEDLAPRLQSLLAKSLEMEVLPDTISDAVIVVIPKPGKDPTLCSSYHPIFLPNVDANTNANANTCQSVKYYHYGPNTP